MRKIYTIGETVMDIAFKGFEPQFALAGGSALNTAVSLGRLGLNTSFITELGDDQIAKSIIEFLSENHIETNCITQYADSKTSLALAFLDEKNNAKYSFYKDLPRERRICTNISFVPNDIFMMSSSFAINKEIRSQFITLISRAKNNGAQIFYDPNVRFAPSDSDYEKKRTLVFENISCAHIVRGSDEDFEILFGCKDGDKIYKEIQRLGCQFLVYTKNENGIEVFAGNEKYTFESDKIEPVSTIGAGDTFNAGIIYGLSKSDKSLNQLTQADVAEIIATATRMATKVCLSTKNYISEDFAKEIIG